MWEMTTSMWTRTGKWRDVIRGQAMNDPNPGTRRRTVFKACENDENVLIQNKVPCGTVGTVGS